MHTLLALVHLATTTTTCSGQFSLKVVNVDSERTEHSP